MSGLYDRIFEQTTRLGLTGKELGSLLGLKKSPLTDWKNHKSAPTLEQLMRMCEIFATSSDYLLFGKVDVLSNNENILLEKFNSLDPVAQNDILEYVQYKVFQSFKNSGCALPGKSEDDKIQGKYIPLDPKNSGDIIA